MAGQSYTRLSIEDFGTILLDTGDLDPIYIALNRMEMSEDKLSRWLVAYWCLYHAGAASWLSERKGPMFWTWLRAAAENLPNKDMPNPLGWEARWPRAKERRHWRGENAIKCVDNLETRYPGGAEEMVQYIAPTAPMGIPIAGALPYKYIAQRVQEHVAFGPWIAYKVADMLERCAGIDIAFSQSDAMYDDPRQAALMLWRQRAGVAPDVRVKDEAGAVSQVVSHLLNRFKDQDAPPGGGRSVGYQEVETILCKWKSHMNGHYPLYNDLHEIRDGATPWATTCSTAAEFLHHLPKPPNA